jgi:hypothetical protein
MKTTPSAEALELASRYEWSVAGVEKLAADIDTALVKARLEGAKEMQEAAAKEGDYVYECEFSALKTVGERILALDPQQVINESMGK